MFRSLADNLFLRHAAKRRKGLEMVHLNAEMHLQLPQVTAGLTAHKALCTGVVHHPDLASPLYGPIEIIGPDCVLILVCGKTEALSQLGRYERCAHGAVRKLALVEAQDDDVLKVQRTQLKRSHYLHALQRLALKGYGGA